jgi:hypothetical protein
MKEVGYRRGLVWIGDEGGLAWAGADGGGRCRQDGGGDDGGYPDHRNKFTIICLHLYIALRFNR